MKSSVNRLHHYTMSRVTTTSAIPAGEMQDQTFQGPYATKPKDTSCNMAVLVASGGNYSIYTKVLVAAAAIALGCALALYLIKPDIVLNTKGNKDDGVNHGQTLLFVGGTFIVACVIIYLLCRTFLN